MLIRSSAKSNSAQYCAVCKRGRWHSFYVIPEEHKNASYGTSFGVFLGYSLGLIPDGYDDDQLRDRMHKKMIRDINAHEEYIAQKIRDAKLQNHSFYFFTLPLNQAK